jgi:hypothetical protein
VGAGIVFFGVLAVLRWLPARARDVEIELVPSSTPQPSDRADAAGEARSQAVT